MKAADERANINIRNVGVKCFKNVKPQGHTQCTIVLIFYNKTSQFSRLWMFLFFRTECGKHLVCNQNQMIPFLKKNSKKSAEFGIITDWCAAVLVIMAHFPPKSSLHNQKPGAIMTNLTFSWCFREQITEPKLPHSLQMKPATTEFEVHWDATSLLLIVHVPRVFFIKQSHIFLHSCSSLVLVI